MNSIRRNPQKPKHLSSFSAIDKSTSKPVGFVLYTYPTKSGNYTYQLRRLKQKKMIFPSFSEVRKHLDKKYNSELQIIAGMTEKSIIKKEKRESRERAGKAAYNMMYEHFNGSFWEYIENKKKS